MPDQNAAPTNPSPTPPATRRAVSEEIPTLSEEFDNPKWTLPPAKVLVIAILALGIVVAVAMWLLRYKPVGAGSIDNVASVELGDKASVLVAITFTVKNTSEKMLYVHGVSAQLRTDKGDFSDTAASAVDYDRYFQAYPTLKQNALPALLAETKIPAGAQARGTVVVTFPVNEDAFEHRKSISVLVEPYDQRPVVITK